MTMVLIVLGVLLCAAASLRVGSGLAWIFVLRRDVSEFHRKVRPLNLCVRVLGITFVVLYVATSLAYGGESAFPPWSFVSRLVPYMAFLVLGALAFNLWLRRSMRER